jgi:hypothetical protein
MVFGTGAGRWTARIVAGLSTIARLLLGPLDGPHRRRAATYSIDDLNLAMLRELPGP